MKLFTTLALISLIASTSYAQQNRDKVTSPPRSQSAFLPAAGDGSFVGGFRGERQKRIVVKGNLAFATYNLQLSQEEVEISNMESRECNALLKRDTAVLKTVWARDFTLDKPLNEVVDGDVALPRYVSLTRMVEAITPVGSDVVYTSGTETFQTLSGDLQVTEPVTRDFFHTWVRKFGVWKLSTKRHQ